MNRHLSSEQICRWVMGEQGAAENEHLVRCSKCREELERFENVLANFQSSVRHWSDRYAAGVRVRHEPVRTHGARRWVLAAAAVLVLVMVPAYQNVREKKRAAEQAAADAILMERVESAVSRTVPRPMEPLIELVSGPSSLTEGSDKRP
ncbi:MAG TPA: hypothetical protein VKU19_11425 [Bryobacteraceae bacterium]|nr:hypothetical protein [Bryobacteraceae bacterium]